MTERYDNLDGLRVISCLCIIAMHIRANAHYNLPPVFDQLVVSWTHFVPLFLMISGFGMFCGYYNHFKDGSFDLNSFYKKRYKKLLPFFITLILLDIIMDRSLSHVIEGFTEATLVFGLLPNNQPEVIGVSWTLGVIFLFYMLFPFIVFTCWTKKRALITLVLSILLSLCCSFYYFTDQFVITGFAARHNFLYCAPFFVGGGMVYLNRDLIKSFVFRYRWIWFIGCICLTVCWYFIPNDDSGISMIKNLVLFLPWLMYAISTKNKVLSNRVMKYLGEISLELYLAQMMIFRIIEKLNCLYLAGQGWISFVVSWATVVIGMIVFIKIWKIFWTVLQKRIGLE